MKHILIILLLISSLYSKKEDFSIIIDEPFNNALLDVIQNYDRTISAVGYIKEYKNKTQKTGTAYTDPFNYLSSLSNKHSSHIHLINFGKNINILNRKSVELDNFSDAVAITKTPEDGYIIGGNTFDGKITIVKLSPQNTIVFSKSFGTTNQNRLKNIISLRDGGIIAIGTSNTTRSHDSDIFQSGLGLNDIYVSKFSKHGNQLWSKKYGTEYDDIGIDAVEANDGSLIILGQTNYEKYKNVTLMRLSENGDNIWIKHYKNDKVTTPYKIIKLKDGNLLVSLSEQNSIYKEQVRLVKVDLQNNILNDKVIHTNYSTIIKDIKEYSDSKIIGVGEVKDKFNTDALSMLFDSNLNMLQQEHYGGDNYDSFNRVRILNDSKAVAVGVNTNKDSQESNMWLVKLNRDLTITQSSPKSINVFEELSEIFKYEISSHKIKIKEDLSIELIDKDLYFEKSQYKLNKTQEKFLKDFSNKLIKFLYTNRELIDTLEIDGHTSSEWANVDFSDTYLNNEKLSMNRSFSTISYIFKNQNEDVQKWLSQVIKGSGLSFSKKVSFNNIENKEKSRRVSFGIILKK